MTTKDGLEIEAIAKEILKSLFENDKNLQLYMSTGRVDYCLNKLISNLKDAHAEGLKKSVVAKVPSADEFLKIYNSDYQSDLHGQQIYDWLLSQIKAVELKMPERKIMNFEWGHEHENSSTFGFNRCLDKIEQMNPELFGEIKK